MTFQNRHRIPLFLRSKVSYSTLRKHPQYKELFRKCPKCSEYSFKPVKDQPNTRLCTQCGYSNNNCR